MRIEYRQGQYAVTPEKGNLQEVRFLRDLPARRFDPKANLWRVPATEDNYQRMVDAGYMVPGPRPTVPPYRVGVQGNNLLLNVPFSAGNVQRCRDIPEYRRWKPGVGWSVKPTRVNIEYILEHFPDAVWDEHAMMHRARVQMIYELAASADKEVIQALEETRITDFEFGTVPFEHQRKAFLLSRDREFFGLFMEQGTGKSKVAIDTAVWLWQQNKIDGVIVVCPNSVKSTWAEDEIPAHMPAHLPRRVMLYSSKMTKKQAATMETLVREGPNFAAGLDWMILNVEAFARKESLPVKMTEKFLKTRRTLFVMDESSRIKEPKAQRTKTLLKLGPLASYRRVMSGTPITNSPLDAFTQMHFLDHNILGFGNYYAFRNRYTLMGGYGGHEILGFVNLDELQASIDPHVFRVLRKDCLDLPPKMYQKRWVTLSETQLKHYKEMRDLMLTEFEGQEVSVQLVITKMLRLQQIIGGFLPLEDGVAALAGGNPKIDALLELAEETEGKMIVWARFIPEIQLITQKLVEKYGPDAVVQFYGAVDEDGRTEARQRFQNLKDPCRFFVANPAAGGMGITLTAASTVVYFSNSFSLEDRLQSEDRAHRIGLQHAVLYVDLLMEDTLDKQLLEALRRKQNFADAVTGDSWKEWI